MDMESARPLRDVFADLAGHEDSPGGSDPRAFLAEHDGLPDDLLVTAIGSYAGTAPAEVAEHLAPIAAATAPDSGLADGHPGADALGGLNLLASAPVGAWEGEVPLEHDVPVVDADDGPDHFGDLGDLSNADSLDDGFHHLDTHIPDTYDVDGHDVQSPEHSTGFAEGGVDHADVEHTDVQHAGFEFDDGPDDTGVDLDDRIDTTHDFPTEDAAESGESDYHHVSDDPADGGEHDPGADHDGHDGLDDHFGGFAG
jgi:hypothetical protein